MSASRIVVVPPVPALLPENASLDDPVATLRTAVSAAVGALVQELVDRYGAGPDGAGPAPLVVVGDGVSADDARRGVRVPMAFRIASALLAEADFAQEPCLVRGDDSAGVARAVAEASAVLVMANGSARRRPGGPGHLDEGSFAFDERLEQALLAGDARAVAETDLGQGEALLAAGTAGLRSVAEAVSVGPGRCWDAETSYADDPYGVRYWVVSWTCRS